LINNKKHLVVLASFCLALVGCDTEQSAPVAAVEPEQTDFVWAVNVGGPEYTGIEGTEYVAEESVSGGEVGHMETVKGSQDEFLYQGYREGDIEIARPLANGTYDITFHFPCVPGRQDRVRSDGDCTECRDRRR
jgi:hypothetical protein